MMARTALGLTILALASTDVFAQSFPVVGATYQLDRSQFPGKVVICVTEKAMVKYMSAKATKDDATAKKMLMDVDTTKDVDRLKANEGCTEISSFSQATVVTKGSGFHRAEFAAFPFGPMWAPALYFGRRVK